MRKSIAASTVLSIGFTVVLTTVCCLLARPMLRWMQIPGDIFSQTYDYMIVVLLGTGATIFYNMVSNILRALGDSKTPLYFLVFSSLLNIVLDILFLVPFKMGVAGAAWATILAQFLSGLLSLVVGWRIFPVLHLNKKDFSHLEQTVVVHLKTGFPMGFQLSVMCIGQLAMQTVVNSLGTAAVAGYTAATKADQLAVYRSAIQSMQNGKIPFAACMIELVMRITATVVLSHMLGYAAVCIASPMAWFGACVLLIPAYYYMMRE